MAKGTLLIIDDEPILVQRLTVHLKDYVHKILSTTCGRDALRILESEEIDCVVCDINMPKISGLQIIKKMREKGNQVPFIFFTGHGDQTMMLEASEYGALDFLHKPDISGLEDIIYKHFQDGSHLIDDTDHDITNYRKVVLKLKNNVA